MEGMEMMMRDYQAGHLCEILDSCGGYTEEDGGISVAVRMRREQLSSCWAVIALETSTLFVNDTQMNKPI